MDVKTVRRDLAAFEELGYEAHQRAKPFQPVYWRYPPGQRPLFAANLLMLPSPTGAFLGNTDANTKQSL